MALSRQVRDWSVQAKIRIDAPHPPRRWAGSAHGPGSACHRWSEFIRRRV